MAAVFGAATSNDISVTAAQNMGGGNGNSLTVGWFYPTTLTATRGLWSAGAIFGAEIDTTTSEMRLRTDNTTDGQWTTTGAGLTVNTPVFLAWLSSTLNTGTAAAWRVWMGTTLAWPTEITVTSAVAPVGGFTGNAGRTIGNKGTGTLAFQGEIDWVSFLACDVVGNNNLFGIDVGGVISNAQAELNLQRWVIPLYLGRQPKFSNPATFASGFSIAHFPLDRGNVVYEYSHDPAIAPTREVTIDGATFSESRWSLAPPFNWPHRLAA